jgi:hypothetical protein
VDQPGNSSSSKPASIPRNLIKSTQEPLEPKKRRKKKKRKKVCLGLFFSLGEPYPYLDDSISS